MFRRSPLPVIVLLGMLVLRSLVPAGYMPGSDSLVTVCSAGGGGLQTIWINPLNGEWVEVEHDTSASPCPWALLSGDVVLPCPAAALAGHRQPSCPGSVKGGRLLVLLPSVLPPVRAPPLV